MKKYSALFVAVIAMMCIILLPSCARNDTPDGEDTTDTAAPNYILDPKFDTDEFLYAYDMDSRTDMIHTMNMVESDDLIYFTKPMSGDRIEYYDKKTGVTDLLCFKPECTHGDDCDSHFPGLQTVSLNFYNGSLWWVGRETHSDPYCLWRADPDGGNRKKISEVHIDGIMVNYNINVTDIHRDHVYLYGLKMVASGADSAKRLTVWGVPLSGGEPEKIFEAEGYGISDWYVKYDANKLYLAFNTNDGSEYAMIDLKTHRSETLFEVSKAYTSGITVKNGKVYFASAISDSAAGSICVFENGEVKELFKAEDKGVKYSSPFIFGDLIVAAQSDRNAGVRNAFISDLSGNIVHSGAVDDSMAPRSEAPDGWPALALVGTRGDNFYLSYIMFDKDSSYYLIKYDTKNNMKPELIGKLKD